MSTIEEELASRSVDRRLEALEAERNRLDLLGDLLLERLGVERNELALIETLETMAALRPSEEARPRLMELGAGHRRHLIRAFAIEALAGDASAEVEQFLVSRLSLERTDRVRLVILVALYKRGFKMCYQEILDLMKSSDYRVQCATINTLADIGLGDETERFRHALEELSATDLTRAARSSLEAALRDLS